MRSSSGCASRTPRVGQSPRFCRSTAGPAVPPLRVTGLQVARCTRSPPGCRTRTPAPCPGCGAAPRPGPGNGPVAQLPGGEQVLVVLHTMGRGGAPRQPWSWTSGSPGASNASSRWVIRGASSTGALARGRAPSTPAPVSAASGRSRLLLVAEIKHVPESDTATPEVPATTRSRPPKPGSSPAPTADPSCNRRLPALVQHRQPARSAPSAIASQEPSWRPPQGPGGWSEDLMRA